MMTPFVLCVLMALGYLILFALTEVLYRYARVPSEWSRKFLHVAGGGLSLLLPLFFRSFWWVLLLVVSFAGLLAVTKRFDLLHSVHKVERPSIGSVIFPLPVLLCFMLMEYQNNLLLFYLPMSVLIVADPAAFVVGRLFPWRPYRIANSGKTLSGSLAFATSTFLLCFIILKEAGCGDNWLVLVFAITFLSTLTEAVSIRGWDNLTVPSLVAVLLLFVDCQPRILP